MSIEIQLCVANKKTNSTAIPSGFVSYECNIKAPSDIINPVIELNFKPIVIIGSEKFFNYAYIPEFGRYYFVNDITYDRGLWIMSLTVDPLASWKSAIGSTSMYVLRSSAQFDGNIIDTLYPMKTGVTISKIYPPLTNWLSWAGFKNGHYVLGLQGVDSADTDGAVYFDLTPAQFVSVVSNFYSNTGSTWWGTLSTGIKNSLNKMDDFIVSCRWYPDDVTWTLDDNNGQGYAVKVGSYNTNVAAPKIKAYPNSVLSYDFVLPDHPQAVSRGQFLNYMPYASYELHDSFIGIYRFKPQDAKVEKSYEVSLLVDHTTGEGLWELSCVDQQTGVVPVYSTAVKVGCEISLNGTSVNVMGLAASIGGALGSAIVNDWAGAAAGIGNAVTDIFGSQVGGNRPSGGFVTYAGTSPCLKAYFQAVNDEDNANHGRPLCQMKTPSSLGGYIEADNPHVAAAGMMSAEADMINGYITSGFYYE